MVPPGQDLCPGRPDYQLPIVDHLIGLIGVGDQLGGMTAEEHHYYGGEKGCHGVVSSMMTGYGVVEDGGSGNWRFAANLTKHLSDLRTPL